MGFVKLILNTDPCWTFRIPTGKTDTDLMFEMECYTLNTLNFSHRCLRKRSISPVQGEAATGEAAGTDGWSQYSYPDGTGSKKMRTDGTEDFIYNCTLLKFLATGLETHLC